MATFYGGWVGNLRTRMELWASSQSIPNNNSVVKQELWLETRNSAWFEDTTYRGMSIEGVSTGSVQNSRYWAPGNTLVLSGQRTIGHNSDGSKTVRGITDFRAVYTGFIDQTINQTLALPKIARATIPTSGNFTTGVAGTINLPRASSSFTHEVTYKFGSKTGTIATAAGASVSWTPPHDLMTEWTTGITAGISITVVTKNGSTTVGSHTIAKTLTAGSSVVPVVGGVTWYDENNTVRNNIGAFVQGKSLVRGTLTGVAGVHGSTVPNDGIARRTIVDGVEAAHGTVFQVNKSGTISASGKVTDSRGRVGTKVANFSQLAYTNPQIVRLSAFRANSSGTATPDGTYIRLNIRTVVKSLVVGSEKNSTTIAIRTRPAGGAWTTRTSKTGALIYDQTSTPIQGGAGADNFLASTSYEIEVTLTDKTGTSVTQTTSVSTAAVTLHLDGTSVGIGKMHEQGALDVGGQIYSNGTLVPDITQLPSMWHVNRQSNGRTAFGTRQAATPYGAGETALMLYPVGDSTGGAFSVMKDGSSSSNVLLRLMDNGDLDIKGRVIEGNPDDTGWIMGNYSSPFSNYNGTTSNRPKWRRINGVTYIQGIATATANTLRTSGTETMFTLPAGFRPLYRADAIMQGSGYNRWHITAHPSGIVTGARYGPDSTHDGNVWLPFSLSFPADQ